MLPYESYTWNNKLSTTTSKSSKFSRLSDRPGEFKIVSIAHEKNHCKVVVDDIERTVHALPSASISAGREFIETVEEGQSSLSPFCTPFFLLLDESPRDRVAD